MGSSVPTAFLSYTSRFGRYPADRPFVHAAREGIQKARYFCRDMSGFGALATPPPETCSREVAEADVFVGVFGPFFGSSLPDDPLRSYAMLEYETALEQGKDVLVFLLSPAFPWPLAEAREPDAQHEAQREFIRRIRENTRHSYEEFASPDALERVVFQGLVEHKLRRDSTDFRARLAVETGTAELSDGDGDVADSEPVPISAGELFAGVADVVSRPEHWAVAREIVTWASEAVGRTQTARVFARIFVDSRRDFGQRLDAAVLGERAFSTDPEPLDYAAWLRSQHERTPDTLGFAVSVFHLLGKWRYQKKLPRRERVVPGEVVVRLLSVLSANMESSGALSAARALYVFTGFQSDPPDGWEPSECDEATRKILVDALSSPRLDPLCARYLLLVLSRWRDVSIDPDVLYELAYALDRGLDPTAQVTRRACTLSEPEQRLVASYLSSGYGRVRSAAALCLARHGHREPRVAQELCRLLHGEAEQDAVLREELWDHLAWLDDHAVLDSLLAGVGAAPDPAGRLAVGWLLRHGHGAPGRAPDASAYELTAGARDLAALRDAFSAVVSSPAGETPDTRWLERPFGRAYEEVGGETARLLRSRSHKIYLIQAPDHTGHPAWYFVQMSRPGRELFHRLMKGSYVFDLTVFGRVVESGYGEQVPEEVVAWMRETYGYETYP